jgi:hypothetical protein
MTRRPAASAALLGVIAVGGTAAAAAALQFGSGPIRWVSLLIAIAAAIWLTHRYWRGIDEAAQEAQKAAWFWGGGGGAIVGLLIILALAENAAPLAGVLPAEASPARILRTGALIVAMSQVAGFLVAWAGWWWSRR